METARVLEPEHNETQTPVLKLVDSPQNRPDDLLQKRTKSKKAYLVCKRCFDVTMSLLAMIVLSPVFLLTAIAIRMEDGGPAIYKQERIGKNEKKFAIYKFRSMKIDSDQIHEMLRKKYENEEVSFKLKDDPRVTKVGRIIRLTNIDELPQLLNIVKGDMSIVGPRPLPTYEYEAERKKYGKRFAKRYQVPQGLTCIWQVSNRGEIEFDERMCMDVNYADNSNFTQDIKLVLTTIKQIFTGKSAY